MGPSYNWFRPFANFIVPAHWIHEIASQFLRDSRGRGGKPRQPAIEWRGRARSESHMQGVNVKSEIGNLKKVILHRPGNELLNLTPNTLEELLFDDIPFLEVAQAEHDAFAGILREEGVEVVYLEDLMAEALDTDPALREKFLDQWIYEAGIRTDLYTQIMSSEGMVRYNTAKKECEAMVSHIDAIINTAMNGGDPMTVQAPTGGCTGSCH